MHIEQSFICLGQDTQNEILIYIYLIINEWQCSYTTTRGSSCLGTCTYTGSVRAPPGQSGPSLECGITFLSCQSAGSEDGRVKENCLSAEFNFISHRDWLNLCSLVSLQSVSHGDPPLNWFQSLAAAMGQSQLREQIQSMTYKPLLNANRDVWVGGLPVWTACRALCWPSPTAWFFPPGSRPTCSPKSPCPESTCTPVHTHTDAKLKPR